MSEGLEISVGISTRNRPEALGRCLDALLAGDRRPAEILVVDQGDDDSAAAVITSRRAGNAPIVHIRQHRLGLSAARNEMLHRATSAVLAVTDDDCVPDKSWVAALVMAFSREPVPDAITGRVLALGPERPGTYAVSLRPQTTPRDFTAPAVPWDVGTGANFAVRCACLRSVGGYDLRLGAGSAGYAGEDLDVYHRILRAGHRIRFAPDAVVYHERINEERRMATRWSYAFGLGALCGLLLGNDDRFGWTILAHWGRRIVSRLVRAAVKLDGDRLRQALLSGSGTARGLQYGWRHRKQAVGPVVRPEAG
jgi:glycosyltransferase involved in cell wall biosynthesis